MIIQKNSLEDVFHALTNEEAGETSAKENEEVKNV